MVRGAHHVDRVREVRRELVDLLERLLGLLGQFRQVEPGLLERVGRHGRVPAPVGEDGDPGAVRYRRGGERLGDRDQQVHAVDGLDARLSVRGLLHADVARDGRGVRLRRPLPGCRPPRLVRHDGLLSRDAPRLFEERATLVHPLDVRDDAVRLFVVSEKGEVLVELQVGLVPDADVVAEADVAAVLRVDRERHPHVPRLGQQPEVARRRPDAAEQVDVLVDEVRALDVRTHDTHPGLGGSRREVGLERVVADLAEPRRVDDGAGDVLLAALADRLGDVRRGNRDEREVDLGRDVEHRGVRRVSEHRVAFRVHRVHLAVVPPLQEVEHRLVAALLRVVRRPHDRDRSRVEEPL